MDTLVIPRKPYDTVESSFLREEIRSGEFEDEAYRRYVNELVYIEWYTTCGQPTGSSLGPPIKNFRLAAHHPAEYDIVRREVDATTRANVEPNGELSVRETDVDARLRRTKTAWRRVQEAPR